MRSLAATALAATALAVVAAAPAGANTLNYTGSLFSGDASDPFLVIDQNGPTTCGSTVDEQFAPAPSTTRARVFAFRNASSSNDCVTVTGASPNCPSQGTFDFTGSVTGGQLLGSDDPNASTCHFSHAHSFTASPGQTAVSFVAGAEDTPFGLAISGSDVAPAHVATASGVLLPGSNTLNVAASSLEDGTAVDGTLTVDAGPGHHYGGPVRCLRVSGHAASLVVTFDGTEQGLASKWKGAVYWLFQDTRGTSDGQRNSLLTQRQLDTTYASCPDPGHPLKGSYQHTGTTQQVLVVANGAQTAT